MPRGADFSAGAAENAIAAFTVKGGRYFAINSSTAESQSMRPDYLIANSHAQPAENTGVFADSPTRFLYSYLLRQLPQDRNRRASAHQHFKIGAPRIVHPRSIGQNLETIPDRVITGRDNF